MNVEGALLTAAKGAIQANLPDIAGSIGAYMTFKDKPYGLQVAIDQAKSQVWVNSLVGSALSLGMTYLRKGGQRGGQRKRNRKRSKAHSQGHK